MAKSSKRERMEQEGDALFASIKKIDPNAVDKQPEKKQKTVGKSFTGPEDLILKAEDFAFEQRKKFSKLVCDALEYYIETFKEE